MSFHPGAAGDPWQYGYPYHPGGMAPNGPTYHGYATTSSWPQAVSEDRIREIIREELKAALDALKDQR